MVRCWYVLFAILVLAPQPAVAQATGAITGVVTDTSEAVVPGATIEATRLDTGQVRAGASGADGSFAVPLLNPGTYQVRALLPGFRTAVRDRVEVRVNETARTDFVLALGNMSEEITVVGGGTLVETRSATLGAVIGQREILDLPLNGRNFTQLGTLIPGVIAPPAALGGQNGNAATAGGIANATGGFHVNGMRNQSNNFLLDGAPNNDSFNTGFVLRPPPDAIQEFKILTHAYDAEFGRNAGSVVNVVTRSGSNDWNGTLWEFNRDDGLQARNYFATGEEKPTLKQNQFGGALGGPLSRNRVFMFSYFEGFRNKEGLTDTRVVPSAAQRRGDFSGGGAIRDPITGLAFADDVVPPDRLHPIAQRIVSDYVPLPTSPGNLVVRSPAVDDAREQLGLRLDAISIARHNLLARYIAGRTKSINPLGGTNFAPSVNRSTVQFRDLMASDTWVLSSERINVLRVSANRIEAEPIVSSGIDPSSLGFAYSGHPLTRGLPFIVVQGLFTAGDAQSHFVKRQNDVFGISNDFTWLAGQHSWKFGGEVRRDRIRATYVFDPNGEYIFTGQYSGSAISDFLLGYPSLFRRTTGDPSLDGTSWAYAGYVQDEFRVNRLTVKYGVRYEVTLPYVEARDRLNAFHPGKQSTVFPGAPTGLVYPGDPGVPRGTYRTDLNNVAPRAALIWDPVGDGRTSVRGAWGLFYDTLPGQGDFFQNGAVASPFQRFTEVIFPLSPTASSFSDPLSGISSDSDFPRGISFVGWGPEFATPRIQHAHVSLQRQVGGDWGVEVGYVGSRARHLPMFADVNPTTPILSPALAIGPRVNPAFSIMRPTFAIARSWYDSLQASARMRQARGANLLVAYTLGHAVDHISGLNSGGEPRPVLPVTIGDPRTIEAALAREKGDALFDVRHRFVISVGYELPQLEARSAAVRRLIGGWQITGIFQAQTGFPLTAIEPSNISLTSSTNRPNMVCDPNSGGARTVTQWFNTACFKRLVLPEDAGRLGDEPRNAVRGPGFNRVDVAFVKNFSVAGRQRIQSRVEVFNALNTPRFGQPGNQIGSPTFGQITSAEDGRIVQLGVKYFF